MPVPADIWWLLPIMIGLTLIVSLTYGLVTQVPKGVKYLQKKIDAWDPDPSSKTSTFGAMLFGSLSSVPKSKPMDVHKAKMILGYKDGNRISPKNLTRRHRTKADETREVSKDREAQLKKINEAYKLLQKSLVA